MEKETEAREGMVTKATLLVMGRAGTRSQPSQKPVQSSFDSTRLTPHRSLALVVQGMRHCLHT